MKTVEKIDEVRSLTEARRLDGQRVGFVPTMGALHQGHLSLIKKAKKQNDFVVVSIFVNPTQFAANEDYDRYISDFRGDATLLEAEGVDVLFVPTVEEMYGNAGTSVSVSEVAGRLCGASRSGHFTGVATVVLKLFNIVAPHSAYFGEKDFQQLQLIKQMVNDLNVSVEIVGSEIIRDDDGLACSTRNQYLSTQEREQAVCIGRSLGLARKMVVDGQKESSVIEKNVIESLESNGLCVEYVSVCDPETLKSVKRVAEDSRIFVAAHIGNTRLIDNILLGAA